MDGRTFLDPAAQEFYPQFALPIPQIYFTYPSPPLLLPPPPPPPPYSHPSQHSDAPSRAVLLSLLPPHAAEPVVRSSMQLFGGVRAVEMSPDGTSTVHFFDLRSAQAAVAEVRDQHVSWQHQHASWQQGLLPVAPRGGRGLVGGHAVWADFAKASLDSPNQGSLSVFSSDPVSADGIRDIFQGFGSVIEVRETANPQRKFIDFFDVRDAARALEELNSKEVFGIRLLVEFSRTGGQAQTQARFHKRSNYSSHQNIPVPPRLRRGGASSHSRSSSSSAGSAGGSGNQIGDKIVLLKRNDSKIRNVARNSNPGSTVRSKVSTSISPPSGPSSSSKQQQQQQSGSSGSSGKKGWKNYPRNHADSRFLFKGEELAIEPAAAASSCSIRDPRTTVMIKNIPNKYSQKLLLNMLDNHCIHCNEQIGDGEEPLSAYDFVYLPIDFNNKCNVGYGFVNLTTPEATVRLYRAFHSKPWEVFNSRKICQVTYARLQGLEALKEHFKNSKFACDNDEYMPVAFSPPRDGKQLTDPVPIGGRCSYKARPDSDLGGASSTTTSTQAPSEQNDGDDDDDNNECCDADRDETDSGLCDEFVQLSYN